MPRYPVDRATNFIVEEESWTVVEYDHTSVPGIIYLSLTEGKINLIYDDVENNIADTDKLAQYNLLIPDNIQIFKINDKINPEFTLIKNGKVFSADVNFISKNKKVAKEVNGVLTAVGNGEADIVIQLADYPEVQQTIHIKVGNEEQEFAAYIKGDSKINLNRKKTFSLQGLSDINDTVEFSLDRDDLAKIISINGNKCEIKANSNNKLGEIVLQAFYNGNTYSKTILIVPLW